MSADWAWPGSRWWRLDLHAHSPASVDFKPEADRDAKDWVAWTNAACDAGLHAIAVTDHNTPDGIAGIQAAAQAHGNLAVFPGVELTVGGIHLVCLLDPGCSRDDVVCLLAKFGIDPPAFGKNETISTKTIIEAIEIATASCAIAVACHANGPKGIITGLGGQDRLKVLAHRGLAGVEVAPVPPNSDGWLDPSSADLQSWLDGSKVEIGRAIPQIQSSDCHSHLEMAQRFTWVKMTRPDIQGLRLALLDGPGSLSRATPSNAGDPNRHAECAIERIAVRNAKYMGKPDEFAVELNPWLNAVIGGRGTGKSTLVDLCRKTLKREHELPGGGDGSLRALFDRRMSVAAKREDEGLLTEESRVEVTYRKDGDRFVISFDQQGRVNTISRLDGDQKVLEDGNIAERFPVRIYSQKQLFDLAKDPNALFAVIDNTEDVRGSEISRAQKEAESKFLSLCAEARSLRTQACELPTRLAALSDVRRKIELLQQGGHAEILKEYRLRKQQNEAWAAIQTANEEHLASLAQKAETLVVVELVEGETPSGDEALQALRRAHAQTRVVVDELRGQVLSGIATSRQKLADLDKGTDLGKWREAIAESEEEYRTVTEQLIQAGIGNPDEYRDLLQKASALDQEIRALEQHRTRAAEREVGAAKELARYRELRDELTRRRTLFAASSSNSQIRVEIHGLAKREDLENFVRDTLSITQFDHDRRAIEDRSAPPTAGGTAWTYEHIDGVTRELREFLSDAKMSWPAKDRRFETALRKLQPERIDRLALYTPTDAVEVSFHDPRDGANQWRRLSQGSPGQQTAALLAFVLGYGEEPIILDQPEDDLDNTLIYEILVQRLRDSKKTRQIIVVTHNPNIVVHGDAELIISLEAAAGQSHIRVTGGLQEQHVRDEICRVMEGGREAFDTRYRRITQ